MSRLRAAFVVSDETHRFDARAFRESMRLVKNSGTLGGVTVVGDLSHYMIGTTTNPKWRRRLRYNAKMRARASGGKR